jgi:hypothetical protein
MYRLFAHAGGIFREKGIAQNSGVGPAHAIAHFLQTKHCKKARHGTLFLTDTTNGTAS